MLIILGSGYFGSPRFQTSSGLMNCLLAPESNNVLIPCVPCLVIIDVGTKKHFPLDG